MNKSICRSRLNAYVHQAGRCYYCHSHMWLKNESQFASSLGLSPAEALKLKCTAEHLTPLSEGGRHNSNNIAAACLFCNQTRHRAKKVRSPQAYETYVQNRITAGRWYCTGCRGLSEKSFSFNLYS